MPDGNVIELSYDAALARRNKVRGRLHEIRREIDRLVTESQAERDEDDDDAIEALVSGEDAPVTLVDHQTQLTNLYAERARVEQLVRRADQQFETAKNKQYSRKAAELKIEQRQNAAQIARLLVELAERNERDRQIRSKCPEGHLRMISGAFPNIGSPKISGSEMWRWFKRMRDNDLLDDWPIPAAAE